MPAPVIYTHHIFVSGRVQGVFYRKYTVSKATQLGVTGWVRNLQDSRVEIVAEGTAEQLAALEAWCHTGSPRSAVTAVDVSDLTPKAEVADAEGNTVLVPNCTTRKSKEFMVRR